MVYEFIGDGWIVLFDAAEHEHVLQFMGKLCEFFDEDVKSNILPFLDCPPEIIGITCGIEVGVLRKMVMMGKDEYIGRPINIACRLQSSVKDGEQEPQYKVLMSRLAYKKLFSHLDLTDWCPKEIVRNLRNIHGGKDSKCVRLNINFIETLISDKNLQ